MSEKIKISIISLSGRQAGSFTITADYPCPLQKKSFTSYSGNFKSFFLYLTGT